MSDIPDPVPADTCPSLREKAQLTLLRKSPVQWRKLDTKTTSCVQGPMLAQSQASIFQ